MKLESKVRSKINKNLFLWIMAIPAIYGVIRYFAINGYSILLAFSDGTPFQAPFTLRNFKMFFQDMQDNGILALALKNTLKYFVVGLIQQFLCYLVAYFLYKKIPGHKIFRFAFYLPCLIAPVITTAIFMEVIRVGGPLYKVMDALFGIQMNNLLSRPETATNTIIVYIFLSGIGTTYLIFMGAMNRIPKEIIEAGKLDGCSTWREFWSIVFPLTFGTYATFFLMSLCGVFTASGPILYMTQGAADTTTLGYWLFTQVMGDSYNYPAAVGLVFTLLGIPILLVCRYIINKANPEVTY
ncbi:MAG: sugar ABC transporter permease [Oscillospiraceae bacterium]|nr:sugar ABC transporter permease [Oscillospiraceae bacterium]